MGGPERVLAHEVLRAMNLPCGFLVEPRDEGDGWTRMPTPHAKDCDRIAMILSAASEKERDGLRSALARAEQRELDALAELDEARALIVDVSRSIRVYEESNSPIQVRRTRECTCTGSCKGAAGLGAGWRCALGSK